MTESKPHSHKQMLDANVRGCSRGHDHSYIEALKFPAQATVTFHNISYKVKVKTGLLCWQKTVEREILKDIKYVF